MCRMLFFQIPSAVGGSVDDQSTEYANIHREDSWWAQTKGQKASETKQQTVDE
jgi:hypothetical protein